MVDGASADEGRGGLLWIGGHKVPEAPACEVDCEGLPAAAVTKGGACLGDDGDGDDAQPDILQTRIL